uniref:Uncharacterized protein n=1 Tax=Romanomermis culicivorax TaxID=13658 RepID=A0A915KUL6_ROMCU
MKKSRSREENVEHQITFPHILNYNLKRGIEGADVFHDVRKGLRNYKKRREADLKLVIVLAHEITMTFFREIDCKAKRFTKISSKRRSTSGVPGNGEDVVAAAAAELLLLFMDEK